MFGQLGDQSLGTYGNLLQPYSEEFFQQSVVDPSMRQYEQQMLPAIQQRFVDANAGSSSALNQALTSSAQDLSNVLAGQRINLQSSMANQNLGALGQIMQMFSQRQFDPIVQGPTSGLLKDLVAAGGQIGGAYMMSSQEVKENLKNYSRGLDIVRELNPKQYDYKVPVEGPQKGRVGFIAEEMPKELLGEKDGIKAVDLYGLVTVLVNAVKQLDAELRELKAGV